MDASTLTWAADLTKLHGKILPRSIATAPDNRTAIELVGPPEAIRQICVVGEIADEATARQVAAYMALTVRLILPDWPGAGRWLTEGFRAVKKRPQVVTMLGWKLRMEWLAESRTVTLKATH